MMAPKKKEPTLTTKFRGTNATSTAQPSTQSDEASNEAATEPPPEDLIQAMEKVRGILSLKTIKKDQKDNALQIIDKVINGMSEILRDRHDRQGKQVPTEDSARLSNIENQLAQLTKAIMDPPQTYAQAVQRNIANARNAVENHPLHPVPGIKERAEKLKRERAKTEVVLTTRNASDDAKNKLMNMSDDVLMNELQQAIADAGMEQIKIRGAQKIANGIKIRCATDREAEEIRSMDWSKVFEGANTVETMHRVVYHGVSKFDIDFEKDKPEEIIERIQGANSEELMIVGVEPLLKRPRNPNAPTQSIIISFRCPKQADNANEMGINIERRHYQISERYIPQCQLRQCFKCQAYGHKASVCTRKARCGKCAQEHETRECQSETIQCANCKGQHCAWSHECSVRQQKREQGEALRNQSSDLYTS
jgi:hypothetical protein